MSSKTNKSIMSRVRKTKTGVALVRRPGIRHFNAKASRRRQLNKKRLLAIPLSKKARQQYHLNNK